MKRMIGIICGCLLAVVIGWAQAGKTIFRGEQDGLSHRHVTQILQDKDGFIWLSTWNGLDRFDGREFVTFKSQPGDGVDMPSDRFRNIAIDDHNPDVINCRVDDNWFHFSLFNGAFTPATPSESHLYMTHPGHGNGRFVSNGGTTRFTLLDHQGIVWNVLNNGISMTIPGSSPINIESWDNPTEVKCISADSIGRIWVASKEDKMVRILDHGTTLYLAPDGTLHSTPVSFGASVYCIYQSQQSKWDVWLGTKPDGIFHLQKKGSRYIVTHLSKDNGGIPANNIYDITLDHYNRLWLATMDAGLVCLDHGKSKTISFGHENHVRHVYVISSNTLVATTTEGLLIVDCTPGHPFSWRLHQREPRRASSLSNNACMGFVCVGGKYFVSTESGGINEIMNDDIHDKKLSFRHFNEGTGLGSDVVLAMIPFNYGKEDGNEDALLAVSSNSIILLKPESNESQKLSTQFFGQYISFSDARPFYSKDGTIYFGLNNGLATIKASAFNSSEHYFPIVLTSINIENKPTEYMVNGLKEINLSPDERTIGIGFAVLDYRNPKNISYAYRVRGDADWHYLGNDNNIRLSELAPGEYLLDLRATNAIGKWNPNIRTLKIIVEPKVTETLWFQLFILLIIIGVLIGVFLTLRYIRRIKAKQKETLEAYLALLEKTKEPEKSLISSTAKLSQEDDAIMNRIISFVEQHLSDSDISVDDMAKAAALSRSSLNRKMKSLVGITPADFLREARIKHACTLLTTTDASVSDIAYRSGFTDPKYFSRVFRQSLGVSPSEYRANK